MIIVKAQAIKLIESCRHGHIANTLGIDFFLSEDFGHGAVEFLSGDSMRGDVFDLFEKFVGHQITLVR